MTQVYSMSFRDFAQIYFNSFWQISGQAGNFDFVNDVADQAFIHFYGIRVFSAHKAQRHFDSEFFFGRYALKIDMQDLLLVGMVLHITYQHFGGFASDFHFKHRSVEHFFFQSVPQGVVVKFNQLGGSFATINDARGFASVAEAAARTRTLHAALKCDNFHINLQ